MEHLVLLRRFIIVLAGMMIISISFTLAASKSTKVTQCQKALNPDQANTEIKRAIDEIQQLQPLNIDWPTLSEGLMAYWAEIQKVNDSQREFESIRRSIEQHRLDSKVGQEQMLKLTAGILNDLKQYQREKALEPIRHSSTRALDGGQTDRYRMESHKWVLQNLLKWFESSGSQAPSPSGPESQRENRRQRMEELLAKQKKSQETKRESPNEKHPENKEQDKQPSEPAEGESGDAAPDENKEPVKNGHPGSEDKGSEEAQNRGFDESENQGSESPKESSNEKRSSPESKSPTPQQGTQRQTDQDQTVQDGPNQDQTDQDRGHQESSHQEPASVQNKPPKATSSESPPKKQSHQPKPESNQVSTEDSDHKSKEPSDPGPESDPGSEPDLNSKPESPDDQKSKGEPKESSCSSPKVSSTTKASCENGSRSSTNQPGSGQAKGKESKNSQGSKGTNTTKTKLNDGAPSDSISRDETSIEEASSTTKSAGALDSKGEPQQSETPSPSESPKKSSGHTPSKPNARIGASQSKGESQSSQTPSEESTQPGLKRARMSQEKSPQGERNGSGSGKHGGDFSIDQKGFLSLLEDLIKRDSKGQLSDNEGLGQKRVAGQNRFESHKERRSDKRKDIEQARFQRERFGSDLFDRNRVDRKLSRHDLDNPNGTEIFWKNKDWFGQFNRQKNKAQRQKKWNPFGDRNESEIIEAMNKMPEVVVKELIATAWKYTLRTYQSSGLLQTNLNQFVELCRKVETFDRMTFLAQYIAMAQNLVLDIEVQGHDFKNFSELTARLITGDTSSFLRTSNYLKRVLTQIKEATELTSDEAVVLELVNRILAGMTPQKEQVDSKAISKSVLAAIKGPLLNPLIQDTYGIRGEEGEWDKLVQDLDSGVLNNYLMATHTRSLIDSATHRTSVPKYDQLHIGNKRPIEDEEYKLEPAEDISQWRQFFRDGPPDKDIFRLLSGDLLEMVYREPHDRPNPLRNREKKITIILYDISDSMTTNQKHLIETALMAGAIDKSQIEVVQGLADHTVIAIPWGYDHGVAETMKSLRQAREFTARILKNPVQGQEGTKITNAIVKGYDYVLEHQKENPSLSRANILFLTDGDDSFNIETVIRKRREIDDRIQLSFQTINIGEGNSQFEAAASDGNGLKAFGYYSYRHISYDDLKTLKNTARTIDLIKDNALMFSAGPIEISPFQRAQLGSMVSKLEEDSFDLMELDPLYLALKSRLEDRVGEEKIKHHTSMDEESVLDRMIDRLISHRWSSELPVKRQIQIKFRWLREMLEFLGQSQSIPRDSLIELMNENQINKIQNWLNLKGGEK